MIPGGTPFSQLNKGVRDAMSATTKRDVEHQIFVKACNWPQVKTKNKQNAKKAESHEGTKKRAPVKSKGKHLCQSGKMQPQEEGFAETRRKQTENTERKHRENTQTGNTQTENTENTQRTHRQKAQREHTQREHTERKHIENAKRKHC